MLLCLWWKHILKSTYSYQYWHMQHLSIHGKYFHCFWGLYGMWYHTVECLLNNTEFSLELGSAEDLGLLYMLLIDLPHRLYLDMWIGSVACTVMIPRYGQTIFPLSYLLGFSFCSPFSLYLFIIAVTMFPLQTNPSWLIRVDSHCTTLTHPRTLVLGPEGCMMTHRLTLWLILVCAHIL